MPNRTIYIRKEDTKKWEALQNKSEKVSRLLNESVPYSTVREPKGFTEQRSITTETLPNKTVIDNIDLNKFVTNSSSRIPSKCLVCGLYACECVK